MKIKWRGNFRDTADGFVNGIAKFQIDYNPFHKNWTLYGDVVDPNGEAFATYSQAEERAEKLNE